MALRQGFRALNKLNGPLLTSPVSQRLLHVNPIRDIKFSDPVSSYVKKIDGITFVDPIALEKSLDPAMPAKDRLRQKMINVGVKFWDPIFTIVKNPVIGINAIGSFSVHLEDDLPHDMIKLRMGKTTIGPFTPAHLSDGLKETMGLQSFHTYMNPQSKTARQLYDVTIKHGHYSITHAATLGIYLLGISKKAELEFNVQRDLVHLARETSARCAAQDEPTFVAMTEQGANLSKEIRENTSKILKSFTVSGKAQDIREERNSLYPLSAAVSLGINGTIRNLRKLVDDIGGTGKELEYRQALSSINDSLHGFLPEIFKSTQSYHSSNEKKKSSRTSSLGLFSIMTSIAAGLAEEKNKPKRAILLLGAPGVGKSTQTERIVKQMPGVMCISTGNLVRKLNKKVENKLPLNEIEKRAAESLDRMKQGKLMDDPAVYALLMAYISPGGEGYEEYLRSHTIILDGVIKANENIKPFDEALTRFNNQTKSPLLLNQVIHITASEQELVSRQETRVAKAKAEGVPERPDDDLNVYRQRLTAYMANTKGVIAYYQSCTNLSEIDSSQGIEKTTKLLIETMNEDKLKENISLTSRR